MLYGKLENNKVTSCVDEKVFRNLFKNTFLPKNLTEEIVKPLGYVLVPTSPCSLVQTSDKVIKFNTELINGVWTRKYYLEAVSAEEAVNRRNRKSREVAKKINALLIETLDTQTSDSYFLKKAWAEYRRKLKALLVSDIDPFLIELPKNPTELLDNATRIKEEAQANVQQHINAVVQARGYDDENSIAKYLVQGNVYYDECVAISLWIGNVWAVANASTATTIDELMASLPVLGA